MGITSGNPIASSQRDLSNFYNRFSVIQRDSARNLLVMEDKRTHKEYLLRELTTNDQSQKQQLQHQVAQKTSLRNKYVVQLEDYLFEKQKSYCSNQFKAYLLFEAPYKTLKQEMLSRRLNRLKDFEEDELFSIIESGVLGLKHLYDINHPHEAVCSANIFMNSEGIIMLSDPWLNNENGAHNMNNHVYASPQKLEVINNQRTDRIDWFTSDLFSLGMVVLETANMEFMDDLYTRNGKELNYLSLDTRIREINYPSIRRMLEILLQRNDRRRPEILSEFAPKQTRPEVVQVPHLPQQSTFQSAQHQQVSSNNSPVTLQPVVPQVTQPPTQVTVTHVVPQSPVVSQPPIVSQHPPLPVQAQLPPRPPQPVQASQIKPSSQKPPIQLPQQANFIPQTRSLSPQPLPHQRSLSGNKYVSGFQPNQIVKNNQTAGIININQTSLSNNNHNHVISHTSLNSPPSSVLQLGNINLQPKQTPVNFSTNTAVQSVSLKPLNTTNNNGNRPLSNSGSSNNNSTNNLLYKQPQTRNKLKTPDIPESLSKIEHPKYPMYNTENLMSTLSNLSTTFTTNPSGLSSLSNGSTSFSNNLNNNFSKVNKPTLYNFPPITSSTLTPSIDSTAISFAKKPVSFAPVYNTNPVSLGSQFITSNTQNSLNFASQNSYSTFGISTSSNNSLGKNTLNQINSNPSLPNIYSHGSSYSNSSIGQAVPTYSGVIYVPYLGTAVNNDNNDNKTFIPTNEQEAALPQSNIYQSTNSLVNISKQFAKDQVNKSYIIDNKPVLEETSNYNKSPSQSISLENSKQNSIIYSIQPAQSQPVEAAEAQIEYNNTQDQDQKYLLNYDYEASSNSSVDLNINSANNITANNSETIEEQQQQPVGTPKRTKPTGLSKYHSTIVEVSESSNTPSEAGDFDTDAGNDGYVTEEYEVGSRYEGYKKNGMRNGRGKFYYQDGGFYEGEWKDNRMHGEGKLYYNETKIAYEGQWFMDEFHGHGKVYNDDPVPLYHPFDYSDFEQIQQFWEYYEGNLVKDTKEGLGKLLLSNGQIYEGEFLHDKIWGKGKFYTISGEIIQGTWADSKLVKIDSTSLKNN